MTKVSGDLMVKLGIGAVLLVLGFVAVRKAGGVASAAASAVLDGINPASANNVVYRGANWVGGNLISSPEGAGKNADGSWTLGGFFYDITHPVTVEKVREVTKPTNVSGNQISVSPPVLGNVATEGGMDFLYF